MIKSWDIKTFIYITARLPVCWSMTVNNAALGEVGLRLDADDAFSDGVVVGLMTRQPRRNSWCQWTWANLWDEWGTMAALPAGWQVPPNIPSILAVLRLIEAAERTKAACCNRITFRQTLCFWLAVLNTILTCYNITWGQHLVGDFHNNWDNVQHLTTTSRWPRPYWRYSSAKTSKTTDLIHK